MAETNISANKVTGAVIEAEDVNELKSAIVTTLSGRNSAGTVTAAQNLGSPTFPWGVLFANSLTIGGKSIDVSLVVSDKNRIQSGQVRSTSDQADFIRVDGATNEATIEAASTDLLYVVNDLAVTLSADILLTSLTVASSGATEECLINDVTLTDQEETKFLGGEDDTIPVDTMGTSITAKVGQVVCLQKGSELMLAFVKSITELTNVKRGYFFDSSGDPIVRETLADDDVLTLMSLGYVFLDKNAVDFDVSYLNPIYSFDTPGSPASGQYWFDLTNKQWKRFDGAIFVTINRTLIGLVVIDTANAIGSRSLDFDLAYSDLNSLSYEEFSDTTITSKDIDNSISVNANTLKTRENRIIFDITTDLASGVSEAADTRFYAYISQDGQRRIDTERPYALNPFLKGYYHPYQSWRCVASFNNDSSSDVDSVIDINELFDPITGRLKGIQTFTSSGTYTRSSGITSVLIKGIGSGGGGGGGSDDSEPTGPGGGGGGGGYVEKFITSVGTGLTVTIAAGGSAGAAASNGGDASDSVFDTILIKGGLGGAGNTGTGGAGGAGGNPTAGDINVEGDDGESDAQGSRGGASALGYGFNSFSFSDAGKAFGGGGAGGNTSASGDAGGAGTTGIIIVYEYS